jgi:hypothetical protein
MTVHEKNQQTDRHETRSVLFHFNGNTSYFTTSTLNTKYIWAVLIKLHDSATYDDRRKSYEWLKNNLYYRCNETVHFLVRDGQFYSARFIGGGNRSSLKKPPTCRKSSI